MHDQSLERNSGLAGNPCLAESATGTGDPIPFTHLPHHGFVTVDPAAFLVMTKAGDGADRTTADASATAAVPAEHAIFGVVLIAARTGRNDQVGDDAATAMGDAPFADESPVEAEGAESGGKGGVTLRPGGRKTFRGFHGLPAFGQKRGDRPVALGQEEVCQMPPQVIVEGLAECAGEGPFPGRPEAFFPVALPGCLGNGEYPADHRAGTGPFSGEGSFQQFPGSLVMWADDFPVAVEQRVRGSGESHQRFVEVTAVRVREPVGGAFRGKADDFVMEVFFQVCFSVHVSSHKSVEAFCNQALASVSISPLFEIGWRYDERQGRFKLSRTVADPVRLPDEVKLEDSLPCQG